MKIIIPALALIVTAFGNPTQDKRGECTPGTYSCTTDSLGWRVCDVSSNWVVSYLEASRKSAPGRGSPTNFLHSMLAPARRTPAAFSSRLAIRHTVFPLAM
jgi:hypothetical protein